MEQDFIAGLYQSLGMPVGAKFSTEDVSLLYHKVFHIPSNTSDVHSAMKKIAGNDNSWSCVGEHVLDVLLEMEKERERKEMLHWDLQLLNAGNLNTFHHMMDHLHQSTDPSPLKKAYSSDSGSLTTCMPEMDSPGQTERLVGKKEPCRRVTSVKRVRKAARQRWARLASEGVQSILPFPLQGQRLGIRGQAWGWVSLSDVLLLVEVKYDVVKYLLYTEMLQEHHTGSVWEMLLPWQQDKEVEELEDLAEEALESADVLRLAELPGAFRIYKADLGASSRSCLESKIQSWSAVSLLNDLHTFRQQERDTLTVLGERLHEESLRLQCLHITLATLRARREKMSYSAFLAAQQSWDSWPQVNSPCRAEQVALWLHDEDEEEDFTTDQQQAVLQLLVLTQELERKHLVRLVHRISPEDLQGPGCTETQKEESHIEAALRNGCLKRLREIHAHLLMHNGTQTPLEQTIPQPQLQPEVQVQEELSQLQLGECAMLLLTHLTELQEVQASTLLQALMDRNAQCLQALRERYETEIQTQRFTNLLHLLTSDAPLTMAIHYPNLMENSNNEQIIAPPSCTGQVEVQNASGGSGEAQTDDSIRGASNEVQDADGTNKQDVCSGCGAIMEDLPYLEILCVSDAKSNTPDGLAAEGRAQTEEEGSAAKIPQSYEKQGSLITLAWSKPPEDDTDYEAEAAGQSQDVESSLKTQVQPAQCEETVRERDREELKPTQTGSPGHCDTQSGDEQRCTVEQLTLNKRPIADQAEEGEAASQCDLRTHASESLQPHLLADSSETDPHADGLCSGESDNTVTESELWDLKGPEPDLHEDQKYSLDATVDCRKEMREPTLLDRDRVREPVSAMERERTMRNLVDMQRKVEQKQQRDRERQLLRVQERLSIIQNRKAEEDLLGLKHFDRLRHVTQDLPLEDKNQQKTAVRERLEQLRRERSYIMQSKRDRNTAGFKELLGPVALHSSQTEDAAD